MSNEAAMTSLQPGCLALGDEHQRQFDLNSFRFDHSLSKAPALQIDRLKELILRLPSPQVYASSSKVELTADLDRAHKDHAIKTALEQALTELETSDTFVMVRSPETDPALTEVFAQLTEAADRFIQQLNSQRINSTLYLFLASPGGVTPYHIDRYSTFLLQLQGTKDVSTWLPWDRQQISDQELEAFFTKTHQQAPQYSEEMARQATVTRIAPGQGVHIPFVSPHVVRNGEEVSASISIIFNTRQNQRQSDALKFNHQLRKKLSLQPRPVNQSAALDSAKSLAYRGYQKARRMLGISDP